MVSQGCTAAVQTGPHTKNPWGLGCWARGRVTPSPPWLKSFLNWWCSSKVAAPEGSALCKAFASSAFVSFELSVFPWETPQNSKCNGKRKQYFKDIGDSETLSWFSSPFSHASHPTLACRWHEFDYPSYSTTQWKTAAPMQKQISMKSETWQWFLRNSL